MTKPAKQHSTPREPLFAPVPLDGKAQTGQKTAHPAEIYSAELVKPAAPKSAPGYSTPGTSGITPVPPAVQPGK